MTREPDSTADDSPESLREQIHEQKGGIVADLVFAVVWVAMVSALVELAGGPQWALYLLLLAGIPAYFVFFTSLEMARKSQE